MTDQSTHPSKEELNAYKHPPTNNRTCQLQLSEQGNGNSQVLMCENI